MRIINDVKKQNTMDEPLILFFYSFEIYVLLPPKIKILNLVHQLYCASKGLRMHMHYVVLFSTISHVSLILTCS